MGYPLNQASFGDYSGGANNREPLWKIPQNQAETMENVMLDGAGRLIPRYATTRYYKFGASTLASLRTLASFYRGTTKYWLAIDSAGASYYGTGVTCPTSWTSLGALGSGDARTACLSANGHLYIANANMSTRRYNGTAQTTAGLKVYEEHGSYTIAGNTSGGSMVASAIYYYRFAVSFGQNDELGIGYWDDGGSTVTLGASDNCVDIDFGQTAANGYTHGNKYHIWRTYANGPDYGPFYYVGSTNAQTFTDTLADYELGIGNDKDQDGTPPNNTKVLCLHGDRMWYGNCTYESINRPMRAYYSWIGEPDYVPNDNFIEVPGARGDEIVAMESFNGSLLVFTRFDVWIVTGSSEYNFSVSRIAQGAGCRGSHTVTNVEGELWYVGNQGILACNGHSVRRIAPGFDFQDYASQLEEASACYDPKYRNYLIIRQADDHGWIVDVDREAIFTMQSPGTVGVDGLDGGHFLVNPPASSGLTDREIYVCGYNAVNGKGVIHKFVDDSAQDTGWNGTTEANEALTITCTYTSSAIHGGDLKSPKIARRALARFTATPGSATVSMLGDGATLSSNSTAAQTMLVPGSETMAMHLQLKVVWADTNIRGLEDGSILYTQLPARLE